MTFDARKVWEEVKANNARLSGCPTHRFRGGAPDFGKKITCFSCGGEMSLPDFGIYIAGYMAAGGDPAKVWPEYASGLKAEARHQSTNSTTPN